MSYTITITDPAAVESTAPETLYVALNNGRSVQITQVYKTVTEHVPFYDGETYRNTIDASFVGAGAGGTTVTESLTFTSSTTPSYSPIPVIQNSYNTDNYFSLQAYKMPSESGDLIAQSDEVLGEIPRLTLKVRTRIKFLRKNDTDELLFRWFWADEIKGVGDAAPL